MWLLGFTAGLGVMLVDYGPYRPWFGPQTVAWKVVGVAMIVIGVIGASALSAVRTSRDTGAHVDGGSA